MATKKKPVITAEQVTDNLHRLFPGQQICCTEVAENWNDTPTFYLETNIMKVVVVGKQVLEKPTIKRWADYFIWCKDTGIAYGKIRTKLGTCIPFIYRKGRGRRHKDNECADLILIACGLKAEPKPKAEPIQRLREIAGKSYVDIYNVLSGVTVLRAHFFHGTAGRRDTLFCAVQTSTGSYKFPLTGSSKTLQEAQEEEIKGLFADLLGIQVIAWQKHPEAEIAA